MVIVTLVPFSMNPISNIPVILMGETVCGKTELIRQLMKMLNKGDEEFLIIKNMHSGVKESEIEEIIKQGEKKLEESKSNIICIFSVFNR